MKLNQILQNYDIIEKIADQEFPMYTTIRIAKFYKEYYVHYNYFIKERSRLQKEYKEEPDRFTKEIENLLEKEIELPKIDIRDAKYLKLSVNDLIRIYDLIE